MTYVSSTGTTLLWGGHDGTAFFGDTWEWDGSGWVQVADTGPAPFAAVGLAFDSIRNIAVLFTSDLNSTAFETWEWDGEAWTQVEDTGPQAANGTFGMVYDRAREVTILEAGTAGTGTPQYPGIGTWAWNGRTWTQVADVGPSQRVLAALAYDAARGRVVLFAGADTAGTAYLRDTWEWDGNTWEEVSNMGPVPRVGHGMTGTNGASLLFGGVQRTAVTPGYQLLRDTWTWDGKYWHQRQDMGPVPRLYHALSWDRARRRGVLFGGVAIVLNALIYLNDTWEAFEAG
jgi:Galactose oxidase, central domain